MTTTEAVAAFKAKKPVIFRLGRYELEYEKISAIIYRINENDRTEMTLELYDKCKHSTSTAAPEAVRLKEG